MRSRVMKEISIVEEIIGLLLVYALAFAFVVTCNSVNRMMMNEAQAS